MRFEDARGGDSVRAWAWDDIVQKFGLNQYENIVTGDISFKDYMRRFCSFT